MKVYVPFTESVEPVVDILIKSFEDLDDDYIELIAYEFSGTASATTVGLGDVGNQIYMDLMIDRWRTFMPIIEQNIGDNIVWLDADCVINKHRGSEFVDTINGLLEDYDFLFQRDKNQHMTRRINMGIFAIKCSEKTLKFVQDWFDLIEAKESRIPGFPQLEWNAFFDDHEKEYEVTFDLLNESFGHLTEDCVIFHAIGGRDKEHMMKNALGKFK